MTTMQTTAWQIFSTIPYVIGFTIFITIFLQYMAGGNKLRWDCKIRIFLAVGIVFALLVGIYEYSGTAVLQQ